MQPKEYLLCSGLDAAVGFIVLGFAEGLGFAAGSIFAVGSSSAQAVALQQVALQQVALQQAVTLQQVWILQEVGTSPWVLKMH